MRTATLFSLVCGLLFTQTALGQSFTVNAGPDKAWCSDLQGIPADTPILGGNSVVTGGTAPYTYDWSILYTDYRGQVFTPSPPTAYLDNYQSTYPKLLQKPGADSMRAVLTVTDATGRIARDTAWVYFQTIACTTGNDPIVSKQAADTVTLVMSGGGCISKFRPYSEYRWRPADYLVDSTVQFARCYTPIQKRYTLYVKDRIGCPLRNSLDVLIEPTSVTNSAGENAFLRFDATAHTLTAQLLGNGRMQLVDMSGKTVWEEALSGSTKATLPASLSAGLYLGILRNEKGQILIRQKLAL